MDWKKTIADYAPTVGAVFGAPGIAVGTAIRSILNMSDTSTDDEVKAALATPEGQEKVRLAEIAYRASVLEADTKKYEIDIKDKDSARQREIQIKDKTPAILSALITIGFFGVLGWMLAKGLPDSGKDAMLIMLGALSAAWTGVISYYFGSSSGSRDKDATIYNMGKK